MITNNFKNKMLKAVRDSIYCFSYKVNGETIEKYPYKTTLGDRLITVNLLYLLPVSSMIAEFGNFFGLFRSLLLHLQAPLRLALISEPHNIF